jgi:hypothetical protein
VPAEPTLIGWKPSSPDFPGALGRPQLFNAAVSDRSFLSPDYLDEQACIEVSDPI